MVEMVEIENYLEIEMFVEFLEIEVVMVDQEMVAADHILKIKMKKFIVYFIKNSDNDKKNDKTER